MSVSLDTVTPRFQGVALRGSLLARLVDATKVGYMYAACMTPKRRLSATVDAELVEASHAAVEAGAAESVSAWVNDALRLKVEHDRRMRALDEFIADYEAQHGEITEQEMTAAARRARERAVVVRGGRAPRNGVA
jgi:Arc/MetJ-type ribon-helix-helix transcriptional regulator